MIPRRSTAPILLRRRVSRRRAMGLGGAAALAGSLAWPPQIASATDTTSTGAAAAQQPLVLAELMPEIKPRAAWAGDLPVTGEIVPEDDVRFLLVHHTASTNEYGPDDVANQIRGFYAFHTGPEKGWPDVAYNFFVDRFGGIWEARAGSIDAAVRGDATGGSQGHAILCSLIGDHSTAEVSPQAKASMAGLLAWLSVRHNVDPTPGTTVGFTSRGSNLWPAGAEVTARTISGHRDMSNTSCPGDFAYDWIGGELPTAVTGMVTNAFSEVAQTTEAAAQTSSSTTMATTTLPADATTPPADESAAQAASPVEPAPGGDADRGRTSVIVGGIAAAVAAAVGGLVRLRNRTTGSDADGRA